MGQDLFLVVASFDSREIARCLRGPGHKVKVCHPEAAVDAISSASIAAVIVDGGTSPRTDFRLITLLKRQRPEVPIVYLSEGGTDELAIEAFRSGARDYYRKPVNIFDLRENVKRLVSLRKYSGGGRKPYLWSSSPTANGPLSRLTSNLPASILRAVAHMEDHLGNDITLAELAEQGGMSKYHFCRVFKKHLGHSPINYLIGLRIERAKTLLKTTDLSLSEIAALVGFNDSSNFSRKFKELNTISPSRYWVEA
jgi:AraC-like DNA-binding protein/CheY-like chemotaxis protein